MHWKGGGGSFQPLSPRRQVPASMAFVTDSNRPQPQQPPPTAFATSSNGLSNCPWGRL